MCQRGKYDLILEQPALVATNPESDKGDNPFLRAPPPRPKHLLLGSTSQYCQIWKSNFNMSVEETNHIQTIIANNYFSFGLKEISLSPFKSVLFSNLIFLALKGFLNILPKTAK